MAKNLLLLFLGGFAIYGAIMIDLNILRERQRSALLSKVAKQPRVIVKNTKPKPIKKKRPAKPMTNNKKNSY